MLTARSGQLDKIKTLDGGADDYITKPFDVFKLIFQDQCGFKAHRTAVQVGHSDIPAADHEPSKPHRNG